MAGDTIDLHGQFVDEAEAILGARIRDARARGQPHLHVIVGKGNHSVGHVRKIGPAVEAMCRDMGIHYAVEENEGRLYVDLTGGQVGAVPPPLPQQPAGHQGGYAGAAAGYPGAQHGGGYQPQQHQQPYQQPHQQQQQQQQHHYQQQQQQQQGDGVEELAKKFLPKIVRELKACCIVM